jgi:hypothetical protein
MRLMHRTALVAVCAAAVACGQTGDSSVWNGDASVEGREEGGQTPQRDSAADAPPMLDSAVGADGSRDAAPPVDSGRDAASVPDSRVDAGPTGRTVLQVSFDDTPLGPYRRDELEADWPGVEGWDQGLEAGRVEIVEGDVAWRGRSLRVLYPEGTYGPSDGGAQWRVRFSESFEELHCSYRLRFGAEFDPVKGGKLPGMFGGEANTGGDVPDGTDGWTARMMWRRELRAVQYVYHPDQPGTYGEDFAWDVERERRFTPGTWHLVEHRIVMNTTGEHDGRIQGWFDGELALDQGGMRFRDVDTFAIDGLYFSTFFGGGDDSWAATQDEYVYFDDFVCTAPH